MGSYPPSHENAYAVFQKPEEDETYYFKELGLSSAPLTSLAFFIGTFCKDYNEDFMLCKNENPDPSHCLLEGRKVTRCVRDLLKQVKQHCNETYDKHWKCLDSTNHEYYSCRSEEKEFNDCVFKKLNLEKHIPGTPPNMPPIHLKPNPIHRYE
ncbi:hypothetical protein HMI54_012788 [Coelomomyces lativittatus]|nr:hypothetical protein HMI55_000985 [Coelomomyces lativittatus]KAJ1515157.1 hypothetical protein HMI54_012788 [Coelomomyces lativittatus]